MEGLAKSVLNPRKEIFARDAGCFSFVTAMEEWLCDSELSQRLLLLSIRPSPTTGILFSDR